MKTIYSKLLLASCIFTFAACNLNQFPYSEIAADEYVKDEKSVNNLVIGVYNGLHNVMEFEWALTEIRTDNTHMFTTGSTAQETKYIETLDEGTISTSNIWVEDYWSSCYAAIDRANKVLINLKVVDNEIKRAQYEGEAKFLRAHLYFNLVRLYGPVFLITKKTTPEEARNMERAPLDNIYNLIEGDLSHIVEGNLLPEEYDSDALGRVTISAAKSLLAKVYMTRYDVGSEGYNKAGELLRDVVEYYGNPQSGAEMVPYDKVFSIDNEMSREIIFAVRYKAGGVGLGAPFSTYFGPQQNGGSVVMGSPKQFNYPSDNLVAAFTINNTETTQDLRKDVTLKEGYFNPTSNKWVDERWCDKFLSQITTEYDGENDWPVIRLADVMLLLAEWINETSGSAQESLSLVNVVRERANAPLLDMATVGTKYDLRQAIRDERRVELAMENHRWFDIMRWGIAVAVVNKSLTTEPFYLDYDRVINPIEEWQVMLPIPGAVTDINPLVAQNPGY